MASSNSWENSGGFPVQQSPTRGFFLVAAALLADGHTVLVTGGTRTMGGGYIGTRDVWLYTGSSPMSWLPSTMVHARYGHTATTLADGRVLIAGSQAYDSSATSAAKTAELFDPATRASAATGNMMEARGWHTATYLPSTGQILIVGGEDPAQVNNGTSVPKKTAEIYDIHTGTFRYTKGTALTYGRSWHTATLLKDGRVLIVGGTGTAPATGPVTAAEIYNPATEAFSPAGAMTIGRRRHAATLLNDGRVLVAGGYPFSPAGSPCEEVYNPATGSFSHVPAIQKTVYGMTLNTLPDGKAIAVGGAVDPASFTNMTIDSQYWIFDPQANPPSFTPGGNCLESVAFHTATALASGCVYVIGGHGVLSSIPASGMLYWPNLVTLALRFQGTGSGSVSILPGGTIYQNNADVQVALGLQVTLTAQPSTPWMTIGWVQVPGTKISPAHWVKAMFRHAPTFDGWGKLAPFNTANPLVVLMDANHSASVNFTDHVTTTNFPFPHF
ncbi:MAG TPA: hypothetical protein VHT51_06560 [Micropepsaceae bacterium]|nr:hypothetical protein [Micropepsaceae bacterium]